MSAVYTMSMPPPPPAACVEEGIQLEGGTLYAVVFGGKCTITPK